VLFEKLVEQHRVYRVVTNAVDFAVAIADDQIRIHLRYVFCNQAKSGRSFAVALVLEAYRLQSEDCFATFVHWSDRFFEPLGRSGRAKLTISIHHNRVTDNRSPTDASDESSCVRLLNPCDDGPDANGVRLGINARVSDDNIVVARTDVLAGKCPERDVVVAEADFQRVCANRRVSIADKVAVQCVRADGRISLTRLVGLHRPRTKSAVGLTVSIVR